MGHRVTENKISIWSFNISKKNKEDEHQFHACLVQNIQEHISSNHRQRPIKITYMYMKLGFIMNIFNQSMSCWWAGLWQKSVSQLENRSDYPFWLITLWPQVTSLFEDSAAYPWTVWGRIVWNKGTTSTFSHIFPYCNFR